ncbi:hypothetical protein [uncultured Polaribacter sp.]|uniref:hypothetical protein n=1 Tax=uncultured Polaribacter sp. TaxID=174711 RepID=UPI00263129BB|nr:hypothetical protein [uncultured Polaribacter sp.]
MNFNKLVYTLLTLFILFTSCKQAPNLTAECNCKTAYLSNLETVNDVSNNFTANLPKNWKTNLYTDALQSSIYLADTTKQLTNSILLDISALKNGIVINDIFKLKIEQENLAEKLIKTEAKEIVFLGKPSYYSISIGIKNNFAYQVFELFVPINNSKSFVAKAEIYGDTNKKERLCKAITLLDKIKLTQNND